MKKKRVPKKAISLVVSIGIVGAVFVYNSYAINKGINPQKVYYTKTDIPPRTKITKDMIQVREIPNDGVPPNAISDMNEIVGKYTSDGYGIAPNSFFYKDKVIPKEKLPDSAILNLKGNEVAFPLLVDIETSAGNSIIPDSYVDLYFKGTVKETNDKNVTIEKPIFGRVAKHVRVTSVKDNNAANVFDPHGAVEGSYDDNLKNEESKNRPLAKIYTFAVNEEENKVLNQGKLIGEIIPVASGQAYKANVERTNDDEIVDWINSQAYSYKVKK
ncbi:Flp pilus assembly protein CpaB [Bacillus sp. AR18-7]|uniref:Flp pilus assembly protein CpaB n=1 Tax=Bacillus sp. AR18-7 TaxID=2217821 RepID=UPI0011CA8D9C|nr:SAF domain-containing protein [Bacillus sp. AR18-7]TXR64560.1 hypothetical protein DN395_11545 [Bacillus sp. AR18-7]